MARMLAFAMALMAGAGVVCLADDPPAPAKQAEKEKGRDRGTGFAQPGALGQPGLGQPGTTTSPWTTMVSATTIARYEEEVESVDAQVSTKRAYIRAAEVGVMSARLKLDRTAKLLDNKVVSKEELEMVKVELDAAIAQLEIRKAESKEVEVRLKHAKKRLDDAKSAPVRPVPARLKGADSKPIDPPR